MSLSTTTPVQIYGDGHALEFPVKPTEQERKNGYWIWDGVKWTNQEGWARIWVSDVPFPDPNVGMLWFDTVSLKIFVWYDDGSSRQWVVAFNLGNVAYQSDLTNLRSSLVTGVTDGSNAPAGTVGEYIELIRTVTFPTTPLDQPVNVGTLPAGDWDCWIYGTASVWTTNIYVDLSPAPIGFNEGWASVTGDGHINSISTPIRANISVPTSINIMLSTNGDGDGPVAGTARVGMSARRVR